MGTFAGAVLTGGALMISVARRATVGDRSTAHGFKLVGAAVATVVAGAAIPLWSAPAAAAVTCTVRPPQPVPAITGVPWPQQRYTPQRLAGIADGRDVVVAVIDSGVDDQHPQLANRVLPGTDVLNRPNDGRDDCVGHGTAVASLIAAQPSAATAFRGLAPGVKILPVRVSEQEFVQGKSTGRAASNVELAEAITFAVNRGAKVINLSLVLAVDDRAVREAVARAVASNVVVIAATGNAHQNGNPTPYPAAYDGVIGVGAITVDGSRLPESQVGPYVDLVAPGGDIPAAATGRGYQTYKGTSMAAPFVSATAALVLQYWPGISARDVTARLLATADPAPGRPGSHEYGHGVLNPYRAVTEGVAKGLPEPISPVPPPTRDRAAEAAAAAAGRARTVALSLAGGVGALALLVVLAANVLPRGRQRRWRPGAPHNLGRT